MIEMRTEKPYLTGGEEETAFISNSEMMRVLMVMFEVMTDVFPHGHLEFVFGVGDVIC